jgi:hypothetical protein
MEELKAENIAAHLKMLRDTQGEEAYRKSIEALARKICHSDQGMALVQGIVAQIGDTSLDLEQLQAESKEAVKQAEEASGEDGPGALGDNNEVFIRALQQQMPNLRTQAHFDLTQSAFQALQVCLNSYFGGDLASAKAAHEGLEKLLDLAAQVKEIDDKIQEEPNVTANEAFKTAPAQYTEDAKVEGFLSDLQGIDDPLKLQQWYSAHKPSMDQVVSQNLRNKLFDAIRNKKKALAN